MNPATLGSPSCTRPLAIPATWDWPEFWDYTHTWMNQQGYAHSTARLYRQVLRNFARFADTEPGSVSKQHIDHYLSRLGRGHCSAHWTAINISTLRTIFDKLFGLDLLTRCSGPRRPYPLPEILSPDEACALLEAASSLRDRLLIELLYGCGLTIGELRRLRWQDLDPEAMTVRAPGNLQLLPRSVRLPQGLLPLVRAAHQQCPPGTLVLPGSPRRSDMSRRSAAKVEATCPGEALARRRKTGGRANRPLSARWIQCLVRDMGRRAGILKPVSPKTLRHTYAVHCLEAGANIREVQTALGHRQVRTTLRYSHCSLPLDARSPLDIKHDLPQRPAPLLPAENLSATSVELTTNLAELTTTPGGFFHLLRMQLGTRLFARRRTTKATTDPP